MSMEKMGACMVLAAEGFCALYFVVAAIFIDPLLAIFAVVFSAAFFLSLALMGRMYTKIEGEK